MRAERTCGLALTLAVVGCLLVGGVPAATAAAEKPKSGGSVVGARTTEPPNYDAAKMPLATSGLNAQMLYDQLFYEDKNGNPTPGLALSLETTNNNTLYTIKLRKGVTFTDGTPFNASAVIAHWTRMQNPAMASPGANDVKEIQSMQAEDDLTVKVALLAPDATFRVPLMIGNMSYIPSPTAVAKYGTTYGTTPATTVGAGPFKLSELVTGDHQTYTKNSTYWDSPRPYLDSVTFKVITDPTTRYNTFASGGADLIDNLNPSAINVDLDKTYNNVSPLPFGGGYGITLNTTQAPTNDLDVRLALAYAVNMPAVLQRAAQGTIPAATMYDKSAPWYSSLALPTSNLKKAQSLIDGYMKRTGQSAVTVNMVVSTAAATLLQALQQEWAKVKGLTVNVSVESQLALTSRIARRDYPNGMTVGSGGTPRGVLNGYLSTSTTNYSFLNDPAMDDAIKAANSTADPAKVKDAMATVAQRFNANMPFLITYRLASAVWLKDNLKGVTGQPDSPTTFKTQHLYKTDA
ncbi:MAG: ABC transporter substrate-binding protein [Mycetocola sp.]